MDLRKKEAPTKPVVSDVSEFMYADVKHLESAAARDVVDVNDDQYSAIGATKNKHVCYSWS